MFPVCYIMFICSEVALYPDLCSNLIHNSVRIYKGNDGQKLQNWSYLNTKQELIC